NNPNLRPSIGQTLENLGTSFRDDVRMQCAWAMQTLRQKMTDQIQARSQRNEADHRTLKASSAGVEERLIERLRDQDTRLLVDGLGHQVLEQLAEQLAEYESIAAAARDSRTAAFNQLRQETATKFEQQSNGLTEMRGYTAAAMHEVQEEVGQQIEHQNQRTLAIQETLASMRQALGAWTERERQRNGEAMTFASGDFEQRLTLQMRGTVTALGREQTKSMEDPQQAMAVRVEEGCSTVATDKTRALDESIGDV
ncbi:MAG: hypothetical protein Q9180_006794, partial [Flavoplaca navasiana]